LRFGEEGYEAADVGRYWSKAIPLGVIFESTSLSGTWPIDSRWRF